MADRSIRDDARAEIERRLAAIESDFGVTIVFACESGSRAWGFASPDSDYDVRFLYVSEPSWYLSVPRLAGPRSCARGPAKRQRL